MQKMIQDALCGRQFQEKEISMADIVFAPYVADACKLNHCGRYQKSWSCPPGVGSFESLKQKYSRFKRAYVFTTKTDLEDCFDVETMETARQNHTRLTDKVIEVLKESGKEFGALGAGSCSICKECTYPKNPCRFPQKMYPSVEACGIDVVELAKTCGINYINGANTVTYFSVIFFN